MTNPNDPVGVNCSAPPHDADSCCGLTKREYFAAMAMQTVMSFYKDVSNEATFPHMAIDSVRMADALIVELNKEPQK